MKFGNRQFTPRIWAVALYVVILACMLWLGNWQLNRAALKVTMQQAAEASLAAPARALSAIDDIRASAANYSRVQLVGRFDNEHQFLWDNRTHQGVAGYEVLLPLILEDERRILVNRGWIAAGMSRERFPDVSLPDSQLSETVTIEGWLSRPSRGFASGDALSATESGWPRRLQYLDYEAMGEALSATLVPALVQAQALEVDGRTVRVMSERDQWLTANWQPAASGPAKHYSYAFQWFAMALGLTILFISVNLRRTDTTPIRETEDNE